MNRAAALAKKLTRIRQSLTTTGKLRQLMGELLANPDDVITLGRWSYFQGTPTVDRYPGWESEHITVGAFSSIGKNATFVLSGNHDHRRVTTSPVRKLLIDEDADSGNGEISGRGGVTIGNDVWVGRDVLFLSGASVGDGAVIGARSVVSGTIPPYAVAAGNPTRIIRPRFDETTVGRLLASAWWELPDETLRGAIDLLSSRNIGAFLDYVEPS